MDFFEKTTKTDEIFKGRVISLRVDEVELTNGEKSTRELVSHPGGVGILPLTDDGEVLMVSQFRKPYEKQLLEIPAGKKEYGEDPLLCGMRELEEETGYKTDDFTYLGTVYPTPGYCDEIITIYLAKNLVKTAQNLDDDEFLSVKKIPLSELVEMVMENKLSDAKTVIAILKANYLLSKGIL